MQEVSNTRRDKPDSHLQTEGELLRTLILPARVESIAVLTSAIDELLEQIGCPLRHQMQIDVAADEVFCNISSYAYPDSQGEAEVRIELLREPLALRLTFIDTGIPYDPLTAPEPDVTLSAEDRTAGGLGVFLVRKTMDSVDYERAGDSNILRITKFIGTALK
ncbi:MAG: ATP-binding protein [Oscillospiraceae bacterium]|nr:ATP-binding protein [Oscillospiraceae bacterium]